MQALIAIICCHVLTGTSSVITRYLAYFMPPVEIAFLRYLLGGLAILPFYFIFKSKIPNKSLMMRIISLGILFFGVFPFLFSWSLAYTTAARGALVLATMPIWTTIISCLMGTERVNYLLVIAVSISLAGLTIALSDQLLVQPFIFKGELIMLAAALSGAIYVIFAKKVLATVPATTMTPLAMLSGCLSLLPFTLLTNSHLALGELSLLQLVLMAYLGVVAGGIAFFLMNWSLNKVSATFNALFVTLNPITAIFLAMIFLDEAIKVNFIVGVIVVFIGLGLAVKAQRLAH